MKYNDHDWLDLLYGYLRMYLSTYTKVLVYVCRHGMK